MNDTTDHTFLLTFDMEEFTLPHERTILSKEQSKNTLEHGYKGSKKLLALLVKHQIPATLFCTYDFFTVYPDIIEKLEDAGCEIALHAYMHADDYRTMDEATVLSRLSEAKKSMEQQLHRPLKGFRGPGFRAPSLGILEKLGFEYDSSLHPTYVPGKYNHLLKSVKITKKGNIYEVPVSVLPFLRLPFSWIWFRNFPLFSSQVCTIINTWFSTYTLQYFHPWEFEDLESCDYPYHDFIWKKTIAHTGQEFEKKLENYIIWAKKRGTFSTIHKYIERFQQHHG